MLGGCVDVALLQRCGDACCCYCFRCLLLVVVLLDLVFVLVILLFLVLLALLVVLVVLVVFVVVVVGWILAELGQNESCSTCFLQERSLHTHPGLFSHHCN